MSNNHYETNYTKQYNQKLAQKEPTLHTISVELTKNPNAFYNNNNQLKINNFTNNGQIKPKKK